jgi:hypothetical protein
MGGECSTQQVGHACKCTIKSLGSGALDTSLKHSWTFSIVYLFCFTHTQRFESSCFIIRIVAFEKTCVCVCVCARVK